MEILATPPSPEIPRVRRKSLLLSPEPATVAILDTASYSPFPPFPGSTHDRDPYGLNAFLLHPHDSLWSYVDPAPAPAPEPQQRPASVEVERGRSIQRRPSLKKQRSLGSLVRPSPLGSQPPLVAEGEVSEVETRTRKRSKSQDSGEKVSTGHEDEETTLTMSSTKSRPSFSLGGKSLRRVLHMGRSVSSGQVQPVSSTSEVPPVPPLPASLLPATPPALDTPSTPMTCRSTSNLSAMSSGSSTGSSDGIRTPSEAVQINVSITSARLVDALQEVEVKKESGKWRGWLGGKKGTKFFKSPSSSGTVTPEPATHPTTSSPRQSALELTKPSTPATLLTPSPSIALPSVNMAMAQGRVMNRQHTWIGDRLRRISHNKLKQIHDPSPHPLALTLRRQRLNLPDDIALSVQAGKRVFPRSVNPFQGINSGLSSDQDELRITAAIKAIVTRLDAGELPECELTWKKAEQNRKTSLRRPSGISDFVARPPFEDRMLVFFPNDTFSPISMARPGYGIWDIDYSAYIVALAEITESSTPWPGITPRGSFVGPVDELDTFVKAIDKILVSEEKEEVLASPEKLYPDKITKESAVDIRVVVTEPSPIPPPESSFKRLRRPVVQSWSYSDDEESEDDESENETLSAIVKDRSPSLRSSTTSTPPATSRPIPPVSNVLADIRARSFPGPSAIVPLKDEREAKERWKENLNKRALETVAAARARRGEFESGEVERRAGAELVKAKHETMARAARSSGSSTVQNKSTTNLTSTHARTSSWSSSNLIGLPGATRSHSRPNSLHHGDAKSNQESSRRATQSPSNHRRIVSHYDNSTPALPPPSQPKSNLRRYHSFYELPPNTSAGVVVNNAYPQLPYQSSIPYGVPAGFVSPMTAARTSMVFPAPPGYPPFQGFGSPSMLPSHVPGIPQGMGYGSLQNLSTRHIAERNSRRLSGIHGFQIA